MSVVSSSLSASLVNVTTATIKNLSMPTADTEYSYAIPAGSKRFLVQNRDIGVIQLSFNSGESGTLFMTLAPGMQLWETNIKSTANVTLYVRSPKANQTLEVLTWV